MTSIRIDRLTVSKILNHAEKGVTAVYDRHSYDQEKREALRNWGRQLAAIVAGRPRLVHYGRSPSYCLRLRLGRQGGGRLPARGLGLTATSQLRQKGP